MRGIFFQQPLEFRLEVEGDQWCQGDEIVCKLSVKNRGSSSEELKGLFLYLACGSLKKVKQKSDDAFAVLTSAEFSSPALIESPVLIEPSAEQSFDWKFQLDKNCSITESAQSLFLICGRGEISEAAGHLQLNVHPHAHIEALTSLLETYHSFVLKGQKSKKQWVESKLIAPTGRKFLTLEHLMLNCCFEEETLLVKYIFHSKKLAGTATSLDISKAKTEFKQQLEPKQYIMPGGFVDNDALEKAISEALATVESKLYS